MQTSDRGVAAIVHHEGEVLKAYRDPVGIWTIGVGLTSKSGVITPKPGMVITREQSRALLKQALNANYEPGVRAAMPNAVQHEFDGGAGFHFNTGAIGRASWVRFWRAGDWANVERSLMQWTKAAGRHLPGLERRRSDEFQLIRYGVYPGERSHRQVVGLARYAIDMTPASIDALRKGLAKLGYAPGGDERGASEIAVRNFQRDHDLTVDGIVGPATLATLRRRLDARTRTTTAAGATGAGGAATQADTAGGAQPAWEVASWVGWAVLAVGAVWLGWLAWQYRDVIAAKVQGALPGLARWLRSV